MPRIASRATSHRVSPGAAPATGCPGSRVSITSASPSPTSKRPRGSSSTSSGANTSTRLDRCRIRDGSWMTEHLNVHPRAVARTIRFFRCGANPVIEVFEYSSPDQDVRPPRNSDVGGHHVALYVADLDAAVEHLHRRDVEVLGPPPPASARTPDSVGSTSSLPGEPSSSSSRIRTAGPGTSSTTRTRNRHRPRRNPPTGRVDFVASQPQQSR